MRDMRGGGDRSQEEVDSDEDQEQDSDEDQLAVPLPPPMTASLVALGTFLLNAHEY